MKAIAVGWINELPWLAAVQVADQRDGEQAEYHDSAAQPAEP